VVGGAARLTHCLAPVTAGPARASTVRGMETYVLTLIGSDRAGLVDALSEVVVEHGGTWERSQVAELAGMFAGVVLVRVPPERADGLVAALEPLHEQGLLDVTARPVHGDPAEVVGETVRFGVVGADRPGIVHEVSHAVASLGIGIVELETWTESAAMAGSVMFRAEAVVRLPDGVGRDDLVGALEGLSNDLMVDVHDD
jgi:glycine cleavage system regulatory protein